MDNETILREKLRRILLALMVCACLLHLIQLFLYPLNPKWFVALIGAVVYGTAQSVTARSLPVTLVTRRAPRYTSRGPQRRTRERACSSFQIFCSRRRRCCRWY